MLDFINENESTVRLSIFLSLLGLFILLEYLYPKRPDSNRKNRWFNNFGIIFVDAVLMKVVSIIIGIHASIYASTHQLGLFNQFSISPILVIIFSIIFLDFAIYWQHRLSHIVPIFWRLHRVHHSDTRIDVSTALRFHPVEIVLSYFIKYILVLLIGVPLMALILFEIILNATAMFNHANFNIPAKWDKYLRKIIVTPDMHRVHHSIYPHETNSNYGFNIPLWDYIFKSYIAQPKDGHQKMQIGITQFRAKSEQSLLKLLTQPLKTNKTNGR